MISIICVYNNIVLLEKFFLKSLNVQSWDYELILVDNTTGRFRSAAEALNWGGKKATGPYLMFIHQDFEMDSIIWLEKVEKILNNLEHVGIAGVAGKYDRNLVSNIKTGYPPILPGPIQINKPQKVQTLDECLFIIPKSVFKEFKFDELVCDNWHLYATDYCLTVKKAGYDVWVIPLGGYHASPGYSFSPDEYYSTLRGIVEKHKTDYRWIYTTTGSWYTSFLDLQILNQKLYYWFYYKLKKYTKI